MSEKFILVKPNADVNHPRLSDLILSSDYPAPKIYTQAAIAHVGTIFVNWSSSIGLSQNTLKVIDSFPHQLGYISTAFATFKFSNGTTSAEGCLPFQYGSLGMILVDADGTNINLKYFSLDINVTPQTIPPFTMQVRYYALVESGY